MDALENAILEINRVVASQAEGDLTQQVNGLGLLVMQI